MLTKSGGDNFVNSRRSRGEGRAPDSENHGGGLGPAQLGFWIELPPGAVDHASKDQICGALSMGRQDLIMVCEPGEIAESL